MAKPSLLLDVGNSRLKCGLWNGGVLTPLPAASSDTGDLQSELECLASTLVDAPAAVAMSSVRGREAREQLTDWVQDQFDQQLIIAEPAAQSCGLTNSYPDPATMGVDRWVAMIGAWAKCGSALCVADLGTATTVDAVGLSGQHLGGLIAPGATLMTRSITERAPGVFVDASAQVVRWADNTQDAVFSGAAWSVFDLVVGFHRRLCQSLDEDVPLLLCGGAAIQLLALKPPVPQLLHCPDLVLEGLGIWLDEQALV